MTLAEHDAVCNGLLRKLDLLKASLKTTEQGDTIASPEYMTVLYELRAATRARLSEIR